MSTKAKRILLFVTPLLILGGFLVTSSLFQDRGATEEKAKISYYTCPMHPQIRSPKKGDCPICGMRLVPVTKEQGNESQHKHEGGMEMPEAKPGRVFISPQKQQLIGVTKEKVTKRFLTKKIRTVGRLTFDPVLAVTQQEYLEALRLGDGSLIKAAKTRLQLLGMSEIWIQELERQRGIDRGLYLAKEGETSYVYATLYEQDLPQIYVGLVAEIFVPGFPERKLTGTLKSIDSVVDPNTRTVQAKIAVIDKEKWLKPDSYVDCIFEIPLGEKLALPRQALLDSGTRKVALVALQGNLFEPRELVVEAEAENYFAVRSGLAEGEEVVTSSQFLIDSESQLKGAMETMGGHPH